MGSEDIPRIDREAMYQAAVSKRADITIPSGVLQFVHGHVMFELWLVAAARAACIQKNTSAIIGASFLWSIISVCLLSCLVSVSFVAAVRHLGLDSY